MTDHRLRNGSRAAADNNDAPPLPPPRFRFDTARRFPLTVGTFTLFTVTPLEDDRALRSDPDRLHSRPEGLPLLAAMMDWGTRRVLSFRLSNTLDARFCTDTLTEGLERCSRPEIFNTDHGS